MRNRHIVVELPQAGVLGLLGGGGQVGGGRRWDGFGRVIRGVIVNRNRDLAFGWVGVFILAWDAAFGLAGVGVLLFRRRCLLIGVLCAQLDDTPSHGDAQGENESRGLKQRGGRQPSEASRRRHSV